MERLRSANLKLQPDKCEFLRKEVGYLGHVIGKDGVRPDPGKIEAVKNFPIPRNVKNIRQFLGLAGYYRRFIDGFSKIAKPLTNLLKKENGYEWTEEHQIAFNTLRGKLCEAPLLQYPDFSKPFVLTTDASGYAIGGILSQGPIGKDKPIAYTSRVLNDCEQKYHTYEKEALAIVYSVQHFRPYLYGHRFTLVTDHKPLVWFQKSTSPDSRVTKWRLKLLEYDFDVVYKAGKTNVNADALSRNPVKSQNTAQVITYERERNGPSQGNDSIPFTEEELLEVPTTLEVQVDIHPTPIQPIRGIQTRNPPRRSGRLAQKSIWLGEGSDSDSSEPENDTPLSVKPKGEESKKLEVNTRRRGRPRKKPPEQMEPEDLDRIDAIDETGNIIEESTAEPIEDEDITSNSEEEMERLKIDDINSENEVDKRETRTVNQQKREELIAV